MRVKVRVGARVARRVAVWVCVEEAVSTGSVGVVRVGVTVGGSGVVVAVFVDVSAGMVGGGVMVTVGSGRVETGVLVSVRVYRGTGVRVWSRDSRVGVGVNRKTPVTTGSFPLSCPSSRRIISNTAGSMGATFS
jgi:hypothetical protein